MEIARQRRDVEIVAVDSMQVYRGMDVGTAKPTQAEQDEVMHHCLDLADVSEDFTVARYRAAYETSAASIASRGHRALLVAGTGLYLRALTDRLTIPGQWPAIKAALEAEADTSQLHRRLTEIDATAATRMTLNNRRRIIRALEVTLGSGRPFSSFGDGLTTYGVTAFRLIGVDVDPAELRERIAARLEEMMQAGLLDEVAGLRGRMSRTARQALGYRELLAHMDGEVTLDAHRVAETGRSGARSAGRLVGMSHAVYAGLGNTFVIDFGVPVDEDEARRVCAAENVDGIINATPGEDGVDLVMVLRNADGSRAEISGNGLACLGQAAVDAATVDGPDVRVATDAGIRRVHAGPGGRVTVDMAEPTIKPLDDGSLFVDVGNPHRVFASGDFVDLGRRHPDVNVEVISQQSGGIGMQVHERGVGVTEACGSGAYASAAAAQHWGWVDGVVTVHQPGGDAIVDLDARTYAVEVTRCR
jgi:tRNA dimethylallyltransferase